MFAVMNTAAFAQEGITFEGYEENLYKKEGTVLLSIREGDSEKYDELYNEVYNCLVNKEESLYVLKYNIFLDDVREVIYDVVFENPDLFYARSGFSYRYTLSGRISEVIFVYTSHTSEEEAKNFYSKLDYILASVLHEGMSDAEKALAIHDYIVDNTTYGKPAVADDAYTSYSVMLDNIGVCQGYSLAYNLLLGHVGIEAKYVSSDAMNHGWSMIKLDDKWYHVDVTWDDPTNVEMVLHNNFLLSDEGIEATGHTGWDSDVPVCDDTRYEDESYSFSMVCGLMKYSDGKFCYEDYKKVDLSELKPGERYYIIDGENYITEYVKTYFDGSGREVVSKEYYNNFEADKKHMLVPVIHNGAKTELADFDHIADSDIFIKTEIEDTETTKLMVAYYSDFRNLVSIKSYEVEAHIGYVSAHISEGAPEDATHMKIMYIGDGLVPLSEYMAIDK